MLITKGILSFIMNINYSKLYTLGFKKRNKEIDLSWSEIAEQCGITGPNAGEVARDRVRRKYFSATRAFDRYDNQLSFMDQIDNIASEQIDSIDNMDFDKPDTYYTYNPNGFHDLNNIIDQQDDYKETINISSDGSITNDKLIELSSDEAKTPEVLLKKHGFDPEKFDLVSAKNTMWNTQTTEEGIKTLYSSKITVKPKEHAISMDDIEKAFLRFSNEREVISEPCLYKKDGKLLEINIADLHLGKLGIKSTCGSAYNIEIAKKRLYSVINDIVNKTSTYQFEKILFVYSNDFFNYDTTTYTTTSGTQQSYDTVWQELFLEGCNILTNIIEELAKIAPVETFYIGANHDKQTSYYTICYLDAWFRNNKYVTVDTSPLSRKIRTFGDNLIYFCHGDIPKKQLNGLLAKEYPVEWGKSKFREIHAAHLHSEQAIIEDCGCICRFLPSVTGIDQWHYENGYTGTVVKTQSFVWDKKFGLECILNSTIID